MSDFKKMKCRPLAIAVLLIFFLIEGGVHASNEKGVYYRQPFVNGGNDLRVQITNTYLGQQVNAMGGCSLNTEHSKSNITAIEYIAGMSPNTSIPSDTLSFPKQTVQIPQYGYPLDDSYSDYVVQQIVVDENATIENLWITNLYNAVYNVTGLKAKHLHIGLSDTLASGEINVASTGDIHVQLLASPSSQLTRVTIDCFSGCLTGNMELFGTNFITLSRFEGVLQVTGGEKGVMKTPKLYSGPNPWA